MCIDKRNGLSLPHVIMSMRDYVNI